MDNFRLQNLIYNILVKVVVWGPVIQVLMLLLKYSGFEFIDAADVMKSGVLFTIIIAIYLISKNIQKYFIYVYSFMIIPTVVGLINLINAESNQAVGFFIIHLAGSMLIISSIISFSNFNVNAINNLVEEIDRSAVLSLVLTFIYLVIYSSQALSDYLYFGPSTGILLVVFPWFVARKKINFAIFCLILIFLGGKRAVMISVLFEIILLLWLFGHDFYRLMITNTIKIFVIFLSLLLLILTIFSDVDFTLVGEFFDLASGRILGSFEGFADDPNKISSGRFAEVNESLNIFTKNTLSIFLGLGFGWSFYWLDEWLHFLHFSPINFLYQYGLFSFLILTLIFISQIHSFYMHFKKHRNIIFGIFFVIFLGQLVEGFFSYMYVVNPFMWCIFGALIAMKKSKHKFISL